MRLFLASVGPGVTGSPIPSWRRLASEDRVRRHHLVDDPDDADVVLFTECNHLVDDWRLRGIRRLPITQRFRDRVYVYDQRDRPWCAFPGAYVSMPGRHFDERFQRAACYVPPAGGSHADRRTRGRDGAPDLLVSFVGSATHPVRRKYFEARHPRGVFEAVDGFLFHDPRSKDFRPRRRRFDDILARSKFVICPRGHGTSSIRLFEVLAAGRVPVVVSDQWVPPDGPDWSAFALRWPEQGSAPDLLAHLEAIEGEAPARGRRAAAAYDEWFAPDVVFDRVASALEQLAQRRAARSFPARGIRGGAYLRLAAATEAARVRSIAGRT